MERVMSLEQKEAVSHFMGPCLCMAGPGSGKTFVLTERIASLVRDHGIEPKRILVVTFTRDAAASMKRRCEEENHIYPSPVFGTFHSVFYNILLREGRLRPENLISGRKALGLLSYSVNECGISEVSDGFYPALLRTISYYKNTGILDENLYPNYTDTRQVKSIISSYRANTVKQGYFDFDDLLVETKSFFEKYPSRLEFWRKNFPFILVDEAQDMNRLQYETVTMLSAPYYNLFLVGDDDQAIYGFRGSDPSFLTQFKNEHPESRLVILNRNYRSDSLIVSSSAKLITVNKNRFEKNLNAASSEPGMIEIITARDEHEEARKVASRINECIKGGTDPSDIAVLYRSRMVTACLMAELAKSEAEASGADRYFYKSFVFSDLMSYLRISQSDVVKRDDFVSALTHPDRNIAVIGVGKSEFSRSEWLLKMQKTVFKEDAEVFIRDINFISRLTPFAAIKYILKSMGYASYIRDRSYSEGLDHSLFAGYAEELLENSKQFRHIGPFCEEMTAQMNKALSEDKDKGGGEGIGYYTFHGSKGLEFDTVFIIGACDGITPSDKADTAERIEEERRIFYVAMTRAKRRLFISVSGKYGNHIYYPSPFLKEAFADS